MKNLLKNLWEKILRFLRWLLGQLKDRRNIVIFLIVLVVMFSEVWVPYLLAVLTGDPWWWGIGSACWAFWLAPFTPFFPLCIAITVAVRKIVDRVTAKKNGSGGDSGGSGSGTGISPSAEKEDGP